MSEQARTLHLVPGLSDYFSGISAAARIIADSQGARIAEARGVTRETVAAAADEVWVHSTWTPAVWRACWLAMRTGKSLVRMTHGNLDPARRSFGAWKKLLAAPVERYFLRRAKKVVATCAAERSWIEAYEPKARVEVVDLKNFDWSRGADAAAKTPAARDGGSRKDSGVFNVLYMGRRHPLKGVQYLEEAVRQLNENPPSSDCRFSLRVVTDAQGVDKEAAFEWCDALCLPTLSENFGIVVAEALARGITAITTDGAPAWADEPRTGFDGAPRLVYLDGFVAADHAGRVRLLEDALQKCMARSLRRNASCASGEEMI